jgi:hypothetical protein
MGDTIIQISRPAPWALLTRGHAKKIDLTPISDPHLPISLLMFLFKSIKNIYIINKRDRE